MGARSSPEGYRVAVGRYGLPVRNRATTTRWPRLVVLVGLVVSIAACSSGGGGGSGSTTSSKSAKPGCATIAKLDEIARAVGQADVHDPATFNKTFVTAVQAYVTNLRKLRGELPPALGSGLDKVEADVQQYRFDAALTDRAPLDAYASRTCGRVAQPLTTTTIASLPTTTAAPGATTTTFAGETTTAVAGDSSTSGTGDSSTTIAGDASTTTTAPSDG